MCISVNLNSANAHHSVFIGKAIRDVALRRSPILMVQVDDMAIGLGLFIEVSDQIRIPRVCDRDVLCDRYVKNTNTRAFQQKYPFRRNVKHQ
jgi:hypothetical protein